MFDGPSLLGLIVVVVLAFAYICIWPRAAPWDDDPWKGLD
jgi:hypothetical protein